MPKMFNALNVPIPPWYALLDDLDKQVPAMDAGIAINAQDQRVKPSELDPAAKKVLADYRMIKYDLRIGKRYSEKTMFGDAPAPEAGRRRGWSWGGRGRTRDQPTTVLAPGLMCTELAKAAISSSSQLSPVQTWISG